MTLRFRLSSSDMTTTAGVAMRPLEINDKGGTFERVGQPGITEAFSHQELAEMMRRPDTTYFAGYFDRAIQEAHRDKPVQVISELSEKTARLVIWRKAVCGAFLALEAAGLVKRTQRAYEQAKAQLASLTARLVGEAATVGPTRQHDFQEKRRSLNHHSREAGGCAGFLTRGQRQSYLTKEAAPVKHRDFGALNSKGNFGTQRQNFATLPNS